MNARGMSSGPLVDEEAMLAKDSMEEVEPVLKVKGVDVLKENRPVVPELAAGPLSLAVETAHNSG